MTFNPIPSWLNQIEYIGNVIKNPCGARPSVYAQAILPAAANLFSVLIEPQPSDAVRGALRPRNAGFRTARHLRGGGRRGGGGIPDVGAEAGKFLGEAAGIKPMVPTGKVAPLVQSFVSVWDAFELTGLALLLVGGFIDAGALYTSQIMDMSCGPDAHGSGPQRFKDNETFLSLLGWQGWTDVEVYPGYSPTEWGTTSGIISRIGGGFLTVVNGTAYNNTPNPRRIRIGFSEDPGHPPTEHISSYFLCPPLGHVDIGYAATRTTGGPMQHWMEVPDGPLQVEALDFWGSTIG